jgi:hypothetical protein
MKRGLLLIGMILVIFLWIAALVGATRQSANTTIQKKIWLPDIYQIANYVNGNFAAIQEVKPSGTLLYLPFDDFKNQFVKTPVTIIIQEDGKVYYIAKKEGLSYATKRMHGSSGDKFFSRVVGIQNSILTIEYHRNWPGYLFGMFLITFVAAVLEIALCYNFGKISKKD